MFFGVLPGSAYADEVVVNITNPYTTIPYYASSAPSSLTDFKVVYFGPSPSGGINVPSNYDWESSLYIRLQQPNFPLNRYFYRFQNRLEFPINFSYDLSGKNFQDFTFSYNPHFRLVYSTQTITNAYWLSGDLFVTFSDGTTNQYSYRSSKPEISFGISKKAGSNQYIMTSDDFNLSVNSSNEDSIFSLTSSEVVSLSSKFASFSGAVGLGGGASMYPVKDLTGMGHLVVEIPSGYFPSSNWNTLGTGNFVVSGADLSLTSSDIFLSKGLVSPSLVTLDKSSPDTVITSFRFSGYIYVSNQIPNIVLTPKNVSYTLYPYIIFNTFAYFNSSETVGGDILQRLDDIYYFLRIDLPLQLRHLIIPTQEEVKDVLEESFDNIAEEYPVAAGTITTIKGQFTDFNAAISGSSTRGLVLPGIVVSVPGSDEKVKLWEDFDLLPYLQSGPARSLMYWVELMLKALIFIYLVRQAASMFISAITGYSYLEWFGLSNKPFMGDDGLGEALPEGYLEREVG